jgi:ApbE superfamily uncharacterized protein (UPF0280 family)
MPFKDHLHRLLENPAVFDHGDVRLNYGDKIIKNPEYQPRTYRAGMGEDRFHSFTAAFLDTDLWIGYNAPGGERISGPLKKKVLETIKDLRSAVESYAQSDRRFRRSFISYEPVGDVPEIVRIMFEASSRAGVGPMAAVAGAFARETARALEEYFELTELVVENGGDNYMKIVRPAVVAVFAGSSPLSGKVALEIPPGSTPLGICTSSGNVGPSLSFGRADALTIVCRDPAQADAYATYFGNRVKTASDIVTVLEEIAGRPDIRAGLIIVGDRIGVRGEFPLRILEEP